MNLENAIKTAIEYETKVRDTYLEATEAAKDPTGKRVLKSLADEEQGHLDYLEHKLDQWTRTGKVTVTQLETSVPKPAIIQAGVEKLVARKGAKADQAEIDLLARALELELETSGFYKRMVDELPAGDRDMFARFEEIEQGHVAIVQAELDNLRGMGFWFDSQEFDLESG